MKKIIVLIAITLTSFKIIAQQPGRVRISFAGFSCEAATPDHLMRLQHDGKGDEVFMFLFAASLNTQGIVVNKYLAQSPVYGDPYDFPGRIGAGSVTDLFGGYKGGIKSGDNYFSTLETGSLDLGLNDALFLVPSIWETDNRPDNGFKPYQNKLENATISAYPVVDQSDNAWQSPYPVIKNFVYPDPLRYTQVAYDDCPIGFSKQGTDAAYIDRMIFLTWPVLYNIATKDLFNKGVGVIPVDFDERNAGLNWSNPAAYKMFLKVEIIRNPSAPAPAPAPRNSAPAPPPPSATVATKVVKTERTAFRMTELKPVFEMSNEFLYGGWKGTKGPGTSSSGEPFSFKFNNNVFWLLNNEGTAIASGGYQVSGSNFSTTCSDAGNTSYTITSTNYNASSGELSGIWSSTGNLYRTGKWIAKKISN